MVYIEFKNEKNAKKTHNIVFGDNSLQFTDNKKLRVSGERWLSTPWKIMASNKLIEWHRTTNVKKLNPLQVFFRKQ